MVLVREMKGERMTVGELRRLLAQFHDDETLVVSGGNDCVEYTHVSDVYGMKACARCQNSEASCDCHRSLASCTCTPKTRATYGMCHYIPEPCRVVVVG